MDTSLRALASDILSKNRTMVLATNRPDGWPQATTVSYVNYGLQLYFYISRLSQKFANIKRDSRVSAAIAANFTDPEKISGISLAGRAALVEDTDEYERVSLMLLQRFPEFAKWPRPNPTLAPLIRLKPTLMSVLDYSKGFGHSDVVTVNSDELRPGGMTQKADWLAP